MNPAVLQRIALDIAARRAVDEVLDCIVAGLVAEPHVALARIWIIGPGDLCSGCSLRDECPDQTRCLHLRASAGHSLEHAESCWHGTDGRFRRFPIGVRKVGGIAAQGEQTVLGALGEEGGWVVDPGWVAREQISCFAGQPLIFRGEVLGVLGLFCRRTPTAEAVRWLRTFADSAATAIANARAFEEIEQLRRQLELERDYLREEVQKVHPVDGIIGTSPAIQRVLSQLAVVAPTDASVLIEGESGTGKELLASALHARSQRHARPLVRVNCASIPAELFESEFFGHLRGAFTGASRERAGRFLIADGGSLFLDEVGEIPLPLQGKLLRALQEGSFSPVGADRNVTVDVRVIAATNRDLEAEVEAGRFRRDLYYRLCVFPLRVPSLRERPEDIPLLASHFLERLRLRQGGPLLQLRRSDAARLQAYSWPGNVRELQNVIERSAILAGRGGRLQVALPAETARPALPNVPIRELEGTARVLSDAELRLRERANMLAALQQTGWKLSGREGAAALLGLHPNTLASRMRKFGLRKPQTPCSLWPDGNSL